MARAIPARRHNATALKSGREPCPDAGSPPALARGRLTANGLDPVILRGGYGGQVRATALAWLDPAPGNERCLWSRQGRTSGKASTAPNWTPCPRRTHRIQGAPRPIRRTHPAPYPGKSTAEVHGHHNAATGSSCLVPGQARGRLHQHRIPRPATALTRAIPPLYRGRTSVNSGPQMDHGDPPAATPATASAVDAVDWPRSQSPMTSDDAPTGQSRPRDFQGPSVA